MHAPILQSEDLRCQIIESLRASLGVEDIAVRHGCSEAYVRDIIAYLRETGTLNARFFERVTPPKGPK